MPNDGQLNGLNILILEDELAIASALREFFLLAGAALVEISPSLGYAQTLIEDNAFDAAVLDVALPEGETYGFAAELAAMNVGVVFHSGNPLPDDMDPALRHAGFELKPGEPPALVAAVARQAAMR
ncbi:MAG: hypothetical protein LJE62_12925 [Silicimonas sp.]|jgi:CheY-like chemotaxis protein|nr:hypothetical protein [Silicimonas sp.]